MKKTFIQLVSWIVIISSLVLVTISFIPPLVHAQGLDTPTPTPTLNPTEWTDYYIGVATADNSQTVTAISILCMVVILVVLIILVLWLVNRRRQ